MNTLKYKTDLWNKNSFYILKPESPPFKKLNLSLNFYFFITTPKNFRVKIFSIRFFCKFAQ